MGTEARIVISEDLVLDFAGLFSPIGEEKQAATSHVEPFLGTGEYKNNYGATKASRTAYRWLREGTG